ncbi:M23 family metallopeptidase [Paenibacillus thermotolerans]|uniref:M23 family metallopeptidase n=1 Tax=Paenibacillus thermotolerans TaxID=3027807 RepID=UPI00236864FD|nr:MULTISPECIES: M23 family metallopeptidase [unclassified Paenibacillus]
MKRTIAAGLASVLISLPLIASTANAASYTVRSGDTLWLIANANGISVNELMSYNGLTSSSIWPGQTLQLPVKNGYTVRYGDTMWLIAQKFGIPLSILAKANPQITNLDNIYAGLVLSIPKKPANFVNGTFPLKAGTYTPFEDNYAVSRDWSPEGPDTRTHEGVDIFARAGTPIYASAGGTVVNIGWNDYGGWRLTVQIDNDTAFYYAHMSGYGSNLYKGAKVSQGQLIGYVGSTGYGPQGTSGKFSPHLHFGMYHTASSPWTTSDPFTHLKWWELNAK